MNGLLRRHAGRPFLLPKYAMSPVRDQIWRFPRNTVVIAVTERATLSFCAATTLRLPSKRSRSAAGRLDAERPS